MSRQVETGKDLSQKIEEIIEATKKLSHKEDGVNFVTQYFDKDKKNKKKEVFLKIETQLQDIDENGYDDVDVLNRYFIVNVEIRDYRKNNSGYNKSVRQYKVDPTSQKITKVDKSGKVDSREINNPSTVELLHMRLEKALQADKVAVANDLFDAMGIKETVLQRTEPSKDATEFQSSDSGDSSDIGDSSDSSDIGDNNWEIVEKDEFTEVVKPIKPAEELIEVDPQLGVKSVDSDSENGSQSSGDANNLMSDLDEIMEKLNIDTTPEKPIANPLEEKNAQPNNDR